MASSSPHHIREIINMIRSLRPKSVLDVGIGFGKWGFLMREYLEAVNQRIYPKQWRVKIEGVEYWKRFVDGMPWLKILYNKIYVGDISDLVDKLPKYDLIFLAHVVEHMPKEKSSVVVKKLFPHANKHVIISLPIEGSLGGPIVDGNKYEQHHSIWTEKEIAAFATTEMPLLKSLVETRKGRVGKGGLFLFGKNK